MNIAKLERMIAVFEAGSFRKAAKSLGMSQPALTSSIGQLEEDLGLALFERGPSGIRPTTSCERLVVRARLIVSEQKRLFAEVEHSARSEQIVLGVHSTIVMSSLAQVVAAFHAREPSVSLRVVKAYSTDLIYQLRSGEIDLALSAAPASGDVEDAITFEPLIRQHYAIFAKPDHAIFALLDRGASVPPQAWVCADTNNLVTRSDAPDLVSNILNKHGMTIEAIAVRTASVQLICRLIIDGGMLGMVPVNHFTKELLVGKVRQIPGSTIEAPPLALLGIEGAYETQARRRLKSLLRSIDATQANCE